MISGLIFLVVGDLQRLCLPRHLSEIITKILSEKHASDYTVHPGVDKTSEIVKREFYWPKMDADIRNFVASCSCQFSKSPTGPPAGLLQPLPPPEGRWSSLTMDFITELPPSDGFDTILTVVDRLTKRIRLIPVCSSDTAEITAQRFLDSVFRDFGIPDSIVTDRDPRFTAKFFKSFFTLLGTKLHPSTAFHPQTDGQSEVANRIVIQALRNLCSYQQDAWKHKLPLVEFAHNNSVNSSTKQTPFFMDTGRHPKTPSSLSKSPTDSLSADLLQKEIQEVISAATEEILAAQAAYADAANAKRRDLQLQVGQAVLLNSKNLPVSGTLNYKRKFLSRFIGPFNILKKVGPVAYQLDLQKALNVHDVFHVSLLKPYYENPSRFETRDAPPPPPIISKDEPVYEVDKILDFRLSKKKILLLVL